MSGAVPLSVLSLLCALVGAIWLWADVDFTLDKRTRLFVGANIDHAIRVAFVGALVGLVLVGFVRRRRLVLAGLLFLEATILIAAVTLVGLDGGTYRERFECTFLCFSPANDVYTIRGHVTYPYVLWGVPILVLLIQAVRVLKEDPPPPRKSRYDQRGWLQLPPDVQTEYSAPKDPQVNATD